MVEETSDRDFMARFTNEEIRIGIEQYAQVELGMSGDDFIAMVKRGEPVAHLHHLAEDVASLLSLLDREEGNTNANNE